MSKRVGMIYTYEDGSQELVYAEDPKFREKSARGMKAWADRLSKMIKIQ